MTRNWKMLLDTSILIKILIWTSLGSAFHNFQFQLYLRSFGQHVAILSKCYIHIHSNTKYQWKQKQPVESDFTTKVSIHLNQSSDPMFWLYRIGFKCICSMVFLVLCINNFDVAFILIINPTNHLSLSIFHNLLE